MIIYFKQLTMLNVLIVSLVPDEFATLNVIMLSLTLISPIFSSATAISVS